MQLKNPWRAVILCTTSLVCVSAVFAQEDDAQYMLLKNEFGELCTMCEATVVCSESDLPELADLTSPEAAPYTLYHLHTKTFFGQIMTIWDYMVRWIEPVIVENRPITIYRVPEGGIRSASRNRTETSVSLSLEPALIEVDGLQIDRWSQQWSAVDGTVVGACKRLPLRETWRVLQDAQPWPERVGEDSGS